MIRRVVYYTDTVGFGGAEQSLLNLIRGLDRGAWRPMLLHQAEPGMEPLAIEARKLGLETIAVHARPRGLPGIRHLVHQIRSLAPDVFHAHLTWPLACRHGLVAAALARVPANVTTAHLFVEIDYGPRCRLEQSILNLGIHRHIAVSHALAARLRETFRIPARRMRVVHNGIPTAQFDRQARPELRSSWSGGRQTPIVLCLARLHRQKGIEFLLQAATRVPDAVFVIVGEGPAREALEAQARELRVQDRFVFLGQRDDVPDLLASCDVFVLPSLWEGLPLSILEAMAANKPVIATNVGGTPEAITNGETGLLVPPEDPTALATAIQSVLHDPEFARGLAARGRAHVRQEFSVETMVSRITAIYEEVLGGRRASGARV
jgi:glycosyltransferase involved in cell wall biosynthesis